MPNQNGAPLRLVVPWKYGFKSIKSIVKINFRESMPETSWHRSNPGEYGFTPTSTDSQPSSLEPGARATHR